ncbi:MAG: pseudouridine-5'-phosphate glycosidase [Acidobacteriota bacterium]
MVTNLSISDDLQVALKEGEPIVALESAVIATGLPSPHNLNAAYRCEAAIRVQGARPATIAIVAGIPKIGCTHEEIDELGLRDDVVKTNLSNLSAVIAQSRWGATTVSTTMHLAARAEIKVFSTGGIGGVHRDAELSFDISSDLVALTHYPLVVISSGAKAILDLPRTVEALETLGVPIIGYRTEDFPAFYSRKSGIKLDVIAEDPGGVARIALAHWRLGFRGGLLVVVPVPESHEIDIAEMELLCKAAVEDARRDQVTGKLLTPYLLGKLEALTNGRTVLTNLALLENNARTAGAIARALAEYEAIELDY